MSDLLDFSPPGQTTFTLSGAKAYFYDAGTTTLRTVYTDQTETVPHPSPLLADSNGRFAQVFVSGGPVKVVVTQSDDSAGYTLDPCVKIAAAGAGASQISFEPTVDLPYTDVQSAIEGAAASAASGFTPFGLGVTGSVELLASLDATNTATGQYRFDGTTTGTFPTGVSASDTGAVQVVRETSGSAWMRLYHDTSDRLFVRRMNTSTWGAWREDITANIGATEGDLIYRGASAWTRLAKGAAGQRLVMNSGATAPQWVNNTVWDFTSTQQAFSLSSKLTVAHGLSGIPTELSGYLICTTAQSPYILNEVLLMPTNQQQGAVGYNIALSADSTNIIARIGTQIVLNNDSGGVLNLTASSWRLVVRAKL